MADPRDPIDDWLGSDIELMHPRPGAFERISRRARRRKNIRALTTAAAAFVIVAAAWTAPQVASTLLPRDSGITRVIGESPVPQASGSPASSPRPSAPAGRRPPRPGRGLSDTSNAVPPAFRPTSATFVGSAAGGAIGQSGPPCPAASCTSVAGTEDYGRTWFGASALAAGPPDGSRGVSQIRFLDQRNGWAFGPQLFATHDGGRTWTLVTGLPAGRVVDLSTVGSRAFAVIASCSGTGSDYAAGCRGFELASAPADADTWAPVPGAAASLPVSPGGLQLTSQGGFLLAHGGLFTGPVTAGRWHAVPISAGGPPCLRGTARQGGQPGAGLLAPGPGIVYLVCTNGQGRASSARLRPLIAYSSSDGGSAWRQRSVLPVRSAASLAVAPGGALVLATSAGIYYSPDATSWHSAQVTGQPPGGFGYVGMTTSLQGVAVPADSQLGEVYITLDGGLTWRPSAIR